MKKVMMRIKRYSGFSLSSIENNPLCLSITSSSGLKQIHEMSVQIVSSSYKLLCADTKQHNQQKLLKSISFQLYHPEGWQEDLYRIYVLVNGKVCWTHNFFLFDSKDAVEADDCVRLEDIDAEPYQRFFIENLLPNKWWNAIHLGHFHENVTERLIQRLMQINSEKGVKQLHKAPNQLVIGYGKDSGERIFASMILGRYFSLNRTHRHQYFSFSDIVSGSCGWKNWESDLSNCRVAIIEITQLEYSSPTINLIHMMVSMIRQEMFGKVTFILHGKQEAVSLLFEKCPSAKDLFSEDDIYRLTPDRALVNDNESDETDEFDELLSSLLENTDAYYAEAEKDATETDAANTVHTIEENACDAESELQQLVGLQRVKEEINVAKSMALFQKMRTDLCLNNNPDSRNHMLFLGNPGTGKTTVARLVGKIYHSIGLVSSGHTIETCRAELVGEYIGHTEKNIQKMIQEARGGVLFIDEAYTLITAENDEKDYGREVLHALLPVLSEPNPDLIVILAGYEHKMEKMLRVNPGLKDRFPLTFHFEDFSSEELVEIAQRTLSAQNYLCTDEAAACLKELIEKASKQRDEYFGNGRWVTNLIHHGILKHMAMRVLSYATQHPQVGYNLQDNRDLLRCIEAVDIRQAEVSLQNCESLKNLSPRPIGFRA